MFDIILEMILILPKSERNVLQGLKATGGVHFKGDSVDCGFSKYSYQRQSIASSDYVSIFKCFLESWSLGGIAWEKSRTKQLLVLFNFESSKIWVQVKRVALYTVDKECSGNNIQNPKYKPILTHSVIAGPNPKPVLTKHTPRNPSQTETVASFRVDLAYIPV